MTRRKAPAPESAPPATAAVPPSVVVPEMGPAASTRAQEPLYSDPLVTLYCGDSLALLPTVIERHGRPEHVLTDPPYDERTRAGAKTSRGTKDVSSGWAGRQGALPSIVPFVASETLVRDALSLASAARWTLAFVAHAHCGALSESPPVGMRFVAWGAWVKPDGAPRFDGRAPANGFESLAVLHSDSLAMRWNSGGKRGVWTHQVERDVAWHPTPKPVSLLREILRDFTDPGDLVIDPFGGSGSTAVACRAEGRRCVAIELDPTYARLAAQRLREGRARPVVQTLPVDGASLALRWGT